MDMSSDNKQSTNKQKNTSTDTARIRASVADGDGEVVAVPSNTATNNSINDQLEVKYLRFGVDSLYLSYQGNLFPYIDQQLSDLKKLAQSDRPEQQVKAQIKLGEHLFEVKDKGTSMFSYVLEDNAFRIQLSRPNKAVPMAYIKLSSEYLTHKLPADAEKHLYSLLKQLGNIESLAHVSRIDLFVDFVSYQNMEAWTREAWVTRASSVNAYAIDNRFTGWTIGLGGVIAARLYDKLYELITSNKAYLIPLWEYSGRKEGEPVWRLEFEFKRDFLKQKNLINLVDVLANLNGLWSYATTEWLKLTQPNHEDETRSRWPIHPMWQALSTIDWETSGGKLQSRFSNTRTPNKNAALHRAFTGLTTWMAIETQTDYELAIHPFFEDLYHYINNHAMNIGADFDTLIKEKVALKARQFNTIDVNAEIYEAYVDEEVAAYRKASDGE
jgi:hypothetical protein